MRSPSTALAVGRPPAPRSWDLPGWESMTLAALLLAGLAIRLYVVRDLPAGLWGDSYHHTMITQLLLDNHGLFSSWQPYAPLETFTYHYGFHANAALLSWLTGLDSARSVVLAGQPAAQPLRTHGRNRS